MLKTNIILISVILVLVIGVTAGISISNYIKKDVELNNKSIGLLAVMTAGTDCWGIKSSHNTNATRIYFKNQRN